MFDVDQILELLISKEGGYSNNPNDAGGETMFGITAAVARANGYTAPMQLLTRDRAKAIYRKQFWENPGFDQVAAVNAAVAGELFDTGVNMGPRVAIGFLQIALNAFNLRGSLYPDITVDDDIGPATMRALKGYFATRNKAGKAESVMLKALNSQQGARYLTIGSRPQNEDFEFGWFDNRVEI